MLTGALYDSRAALSHGFADEVVEAGAAGRARRCGRSTLGRDSLEAYATIKAQLLGQR